MSFPKFSPDLQISFFLRLKTIKSLYFHEALGSTVSQLQISHIDKQLNKYVSNIALSRLATFSLRGETIFPLPIILKANPYLLGYYRLLFGVSQKEFYKSLGRFKGMEGKGMLSKIANNQLEELCQSLILTGEEFVNNIDEISISTLSELQLLTVGAQLRGSKNNEYGQIATQKTFEIIKSLVSNYITTTTETSIDIINDSGRQVTIAFSSDPDIEISEKMSSSKRGLISIEIKGGTDFSNIHNRIGEAEKSHQKAKKRGYFEFMTIISVDIDYTSLRAESPTTTHFFHLKKIADKNSSEYSQFTDILSSVLSVNI